MIVNFDEVLQIFRRNFAGLYCFRINEILCRCVKFHLANSLKVVKCRSKFPRKFPFVGAKFPTFCLCEQNFERKSRLEIEISFTICVHYTRVTRCKRQTEPKKNSSLMAVRVEKH